MSKRLPNNQPPGRGPAAMIDDFNLPGLSRRNSATPPAPTGHSMHSPQSQGSLQSPFDSMNEQLRRAYIGGGNKIQNKIPQGPSNLQQHNQGGTRLQRQQSFMLNQNRNHGGSSHGHERDASFGTQVSGSSQGMGRPNSSSGLGNFNLAGPPASTGPSSILSMSPEQYTRFFGEKVAEIEAMIASRTGLPGAFRDQFRAQLRDLSQSMLENQQTMRREYDRIDTEAKEFRRRLENATVETNRYNHDWKKLDAKQKKSLENLRQLQSRWEQRNAELLKQVEIQKEQLDGKRALWMDANPGSSARRDAMKETMGDPFQSPTATTSNKALTSAMGNIKSSTLPGQSAESFSNQQGSQFGPPHFYNQQHVGFNATYQNTLPMRASTERNFGGRPKPHRPTPAGPPPSLSQIMHLPPGVTSSSGYGPPYISTHQSHQSFSRFPQRNPHTSSALVVHDPTIESSERLSSEYKEAIQEVYDHIHAWVLKYANIPNPENDRKTARSNGMLWDYMMNCAYPGNRQDSHTHIVALLSDQTAKHWFVMRLAAQYCVKDIMGIEAFKPYSKEVAMIIDEMIEKLKERGLAMETRQVHINRGMAAVQSVLAAQDYVSFRAKQLNFHTKALRDILGPMLNDGVERSDAGKDLGPIVLQSWDLCGAMHREGFTYQIYFPDTASKFTAATMESMDRPAADPMQLQIKQVRVKLVVTPVITMRDDRGTTIRAKSLHSCKVLLMS